MIGNISTILRKAITKKVFIAFCIFVHFGLLCAIVDCLCHPQIYYLVAFSPQDVQYYCSINYENTKPFENTISYRVYLIQKLKKENFKICDGMCCIHISDFYDYIESCKTENKQQ